MSILSVKNLEKKFGDLTVLKNISFNINDGEIISIIGSSGSGKSTFIRMLLKEIDPTEGTITVGNADLSVIKRKQIPYYRRKIGMVYQDFRLIPTLNVFCLFLQIRIFNNNESRLSACNFVFIIINNNVIFNSFFDYNIFLI